MKTLLTFVSLAVLAGCAYPPPAPSNYGARMQGPADSNQWHVVSVTPVAPGTGERLATTSGKGTAAPDAAVLYRSDAVTTDVPQPVYVQQPVYVAAPLYQPYPYYASPYYYPPVSVGFDFMFGSSWGGHRGGRNWGGVGVGTRWRH